MLIWQLTFFVVDWLLLMMAMVLLLLFVSRAVDDGCLPLTALENGMTAVEVALALS